MDKVLLFGGSFDPIHHGHLIVSRHAAERLGVERIILIPSLCPPHKAGQRLAPAEDRLAMCRLGVGDDPQFEVSDWEMTQVGPNYTLHTVRRFAEVLGSNTVLYWLVGSDSLKELGGWHRAADLVEACTIVTVARPGTAEPDSAALAASFTAPQVEKLLQHVLPGPRIDIGGTDIRGRVGRGRSIRYLVPEAVRAHIAEHGLYRSV